MPRQRLSIEEIKAIKGDKRFCPACGSKTIEGTISEDGEEIIIKKCSKLCGWWG